MMNASTSLCIVPITACELYVKITLLVCYMSGDHLPNTRRSTAPRVYLLFFLGKQSDTAKLCLDPGGFGSNKLTTTWACSSKLPL